MRTTDEHGWAQMMSGIYFKIRKLDERRDAACTACRETRQLQ